MDLITVSRRNQGKYVHDHHPYASHDEDFQMGFLEACDFFQYIKCWFSLATAHQLWPPSNDYERNHAFDGKLLVWNHYWDKWEAAEHGPHTFYESLDYGNRAVLYRWYKKHVKETH